MIPFKDIELPYIFNVTPDESGSMEDGRTEQNWNGRLNSLKKLIDKTSTKQRQEASRRSRFLEDKIDKIDGDMRDMMDTMSKDMSTLKRLLLENKKADSRPLLKR